MMAFAPGELSTIAGPLESFWSNGTTTRAFNVADMPCPPQSVMEENWYYPSLGQPYLPLIAFPSRALSIEPYFEYCKTGFFTALDPPKTLEPAIAMVPSPTTIHAIVRPPTPMPSRIQDPVPTNTGAGGDPGDHSAQATRSRFVPQPPIDAAGLPPMRTPASRASLQPSQIVNSVLGPNSETSDVDTHQAGEPQPGQTTNNIGEGINGGTGQVDTVSDPHPGGQLADPGNGKPPGESHESTASQRVVLGIPNNDPSQSDSGDKNDISGGHSNPSHIDSNFEPQDPNSPINWSNLSPKQMSQLHDALNSHQSASPAQPEHSLGSGQAINDLSGSADDHESAPVINGQQGGNAVGSDPESNPEAEQGGSPSHFDGSDVPSSIMESIKDALSGNHNSHQAQPAGKDGDNSGDGVGGTGPPSDQGGNPNARPAYNAGDSDPTAATLNTKQWSPSQVSGIAKALLPNGSPNELSAVAKALAPTEPNPSPNQISAIHDALVASGPKVTSDQISSIRDTLASSGSSSSTDLVAKINDALGPSGSKLSPEQASNIRDTFTHDETGTRLSAEQVSNIESALASSGPTSLPDQLINIINALSPSGTNLSPNQLASIENILATAGPELSPSQVSAMNSALSPPPTQPSLSPSRISAINNILATSGPIPSPDQISDIINALFPSGTTLSPSQTSAIKDILSSSTPTSLSPDLLSSINAIIAPSAASSSAGDVSATHVSGFNDALPTKGSARSVSGDAAASTTLDGDERGGSATTGAERGSGTHTRKSGGVRSLDIGVGLYASFVSTLLVIVIGCTF